MAMVEDLGIVATGILQGIGQNGEPGGFECPEDIRAEHQPRARAWEMSLGNPGVSHARARAWCSSVIASAPSFEAILSGQPLTVAAASV